MTEIQIRPSYVVLSFATLALGLAADVRTDIVGQLLLSAVIWVLLLCLLGRMPKSTRFPLMACMAIATIGELVLSLGWGLYTYRLGNIPLFVPPGHVLMFMLGLALTRHMSDTFAYAITGGAAVYAIASAAMGVDTLSVPLILVVALAWLLLPAHRRLFTSTFVLSLALELYGTWLGNWAWARDVPGMLLVTTNPPGVVGAFYCALDALVAVLVFSVIPRLKAHAPA